MALKKLGKALATGLISAGEEFKAHGAMRVKEEYMAEEKATAAAAAHQDKLQFLYEETGKDIRSITKAMSEGIQGNPIEMQSSLDKLKARQNILLAEIMGITLPKEQEDYLSGVAEGTIETKEASEKSELFKNLIGFSKYLLKNAKDKGIEVAKKFLQEAHPDVWSDTKNNLERTRVRYIGSGEDREEIKGPVSDEEIIGDIMSLLVETQGMDTARRFFEGMVSGWSLDSSFWPKLEFPEREGQYGSSLLDDATLKEDYKSEEEYRKEAIEERGERQFEGQEDTSDERTERFDPSPVDPRFTRNPFVEEQLTPGKIEQGLIEQGSTVGGGGGGGATQEQQDLMAAGGVLGGSEFVETPIGRETQDISGAVGSEEALTSFFRDVGGPVGEPTGTTDILTRSNIPEEAPEVEQRKSRIISALTDLILRAEANVNGYNSIAGSTEGDPNLTNMTMGEIIAKYGNRAVGAGQFKYKEFTLPIVKKYLNMSEDELKQQVFTEQFQNDLIALGLEDAGLSLMAKQEISEEEFQRRVANIWRGLPATKETKVGESTDEYGNKANIEGGLLNQAITGQ